MPETIPPLPLRDIIAPLDPGWWPPAPGWWIIATILLFLTGWVLRALNRYFTYEYAALRKAALRELLELESQSGLSDRNFARQISALLKRVSIVRYTDQQPAKLSGEAWLSFLDQSGGDQPFSQTGGGTLLVAQYQAETTIERNELLTAARTWIKAI